jgi:stage V sporulation protein SpoVS
MTAAVDLDALLNTYASFLAEGGKDLLTYPSFCHLPIKSEQL